MNYITNPWAVYWITRLDGIIVAIVVAILCATLVFIIMLAGIITEDNEYCKKHIKKILVVIGLLLLMLIFIPTKKNVIEIITCENYNYNYNNNNNNNNDAVESNTIDKTKE